MQKIFKIMLVTLCLLIGVTPKKVTAEEPVTSNSTTTIDSFTITNAEQTYSPNVNEKNHVVKYTLALSTSGDDGSIKTTTIEVPKTLFNNRSGEVGDEFKVSIPTKEEYENATSQGVEVDSMWMYEDKGNSIVISSIKPLKTGTTYNIEFGYELSGSISGFRDGETAKTLEAKIKMDTAGGELHTTATAEEVTINTSVTLLGSKSDADSIQAITDEWQDIWGTKPADADDYLYSQVRVSSFISGSQPYTLTINSKAVDKETGEEFTPYMYSIGVSGWKTGNTEENSLLFNNTNGRNDYVLYRFPKSTYSTKETINFKVTNEVITQGADNLDPASEPSVSETTIQYSKEPWKVEEGNFITLQNGDNYFRVNSKEMEKWSLVNTKIDKYSRFDLQNFQNGTLTKYDGLDFGQFMYGRPSFRTVPNGLPVTPENYFKENVTYTQFVNGIGLVSEDKTVDNDLDFNDYQIKNLSIYAEYRTATFSSMSNKFVEHNATPSDDDVIEVYAKYLNKDNDYVHIADYSSKNNSYTFHRDGLDSVNNKLILDDNVVAYKLVNSNKYAYTKILSGTEYMLKHSTKIDEFVKNKDSITIQSNLYATLDDSTGEQIFDYEAPKEYDFARRTETTSSIHKNVANVRNNRIKKQYEVTWEIDVQEIAKLTGEDFEYIPQEGGKWFDLMPAGLILDEDSVELVDDVTGQKLSVSVTSKQNYRNTGRTLYTFTSPDKFNKSILRFKTILDYDSVRDYGNMIYNPIAFETGNSSITNGSYRVAKNLLHYKREMSNLSDNLGDRMIFADKSYNLATLVYFSSGLQKSIKNSTDSSYSKYTQVSPNEEYEYKLTFANASNASSKDIVLFDSIENYTTSSGEVSNWRGILQSIDTTQIENMGINPVVYASDVAMNLETLRGLSSTEMLNKFRPISEFSDYSTIKTIAIDCRTSKDGSPFTLDKSKAVVAKLNMKAPDSLPVNGTIYKNFNNVYANLTSIEIGGEEMNAYINQGYTTNTYKITGNVFVNKINSETKQGASGIKFELFGTSAYNEEVDMIRTSDSNGIVSFKKIPVGKYMLVEYDSTEHYFIDTTKHIVEVTKYGEVLIDGKTTSAITLENKPRVSANVKFEKKSYPNSMGISVPVGGASFTLQGKSDYGNDVLETSTSDESGKVEFKNIEKGTYKMFETKAPKEYVKSSDEYKVVIDANGIATITNVTENKNEDVVYNYRRLVSVSFKKLNAETNEPISSGYNASEGISFTISGQDAEGRVINKTVWVDNRGIAKVDVPVGIYTVQENPDPKDLDKKSYLRDSREYILEVKKDGTFTLDMEKVGDDYVVKNTQLATDVITITKQWVGGNPDGYIPKIRIYTNPNDIPQAKNNTSENNQGIPEIAEPDEGL